MKRAIYVFSFMILAVLAIVLIVGSTVTAEKGWPINEDGEPATGGSWQGSGQMDVPPLNLRADWYNDTDGDEAWVIEDGDNILRSFSAFDYSYDLTVEQGGTLTLDSVNFLVNISEGNRIIHIENGGTLIITNSSIACFEIHIEAGGTLHFHPGNGSNSLTILSMDSAGIIIPRGANFELMNTSVNGQTTLLTLEDDDALVRYNTFSTGGNGAACILLKASPSIANNTFNEGSSIGSWAIIAEAGVTSEIYGNTFDGFFHEGFRRYGGAIKSFGPIEIYDNLFTKMIADNADTDPYIIYFVGTEPTDHDGQPVWETNRFRGRNKNVGDERVNVFMQAWNIDVVVTNSHSGNPISGTLAEIRDVDDFIVGTGSTGTDGTISFEIAEFIVSAMDDGDTGKTDKNPRDKNPFDISVSKASVTDALHDQTIDENMLFTFDLAISEFDFGVSDIRVPDLIYAGDEVNLRATVFNTGYDRSTNVTVEFHILDVSRGEILLGDVIVFVNLDFVFAFLDATIPIEYGETQILFRARTVFAGDENASNDAFSTDPIYINMKPTVTITSPLTGAAFEGPFTVTGTATGVGPGSEVHVNIVGPVNRDWSMADGTSDWEIDIETLGLKNGEYQLNARARDEHGTFSELATITFHVENKPSVVINSPTDGSLLRGNETHTMTGGTQKIEAEITRVTVTIDDMQVFNASKVTADWAQWTFALRTLEQDIINTLSDGEHTFTATVYDANGLNNSVTFTYIVYSTDPDTNPGVTITTEPFTLLGDKWVEGTATDDYRVVAIDYRLNDGDWSSAQDIQNLGTPSVAWRALIGTNHKDLEEGVNIFYVRASDNDGSTTRTLQFTVEASGMVDITIGNVVMLNSDGNALKTDDLKVSNFIRVVVTVNIASTGATIRQLPVRVQIAGVDAGSETRDNVTTTFDVSFSVRLTEAMQDKKDIKVIVGTGDDRVEWDSELPGTIGGAKGGGDGDDDGSFLPGFEAVIMVVALVLGGLMISTRKRRE